MSALALAGGMLFGCGGATDTASTPTELPASVQVRETATILSVTTTLPAGGTSTSSEMQSMLYTFAATISGPDARLALSGTLVLKGERHDDGSTEVEGRLLPTSIGMTPLTPSDGALALSGVDLQAQLDAQRAALKSALRTDVDALSATLKLALADGAVAGTREPSAAQKEAMAAFKAAFDLRVAQYRAALSALSGDDSVTMSSDSQSPRPTADGDRKRARGYEVAGTIDAQGAVKLTIKLGDNRKVLAIGSMAADGSMSGTLTGPASTDTGTWTAQAAGAPPPPPPPPPPAPCAAQSMVSWTQGASTCNAAYAGAASGITSLLSDIVAPTTGTATAVCTNGVLTTTVPVCVTAPPPNAANGRVLYTTMPAGLFASCATCHGSPPSTSGVLNGANNPTVIANAITSNKGGMGMFVGKFTDAQLADIAAYIANPNVP